MLTRLELRQRDVELAKERVIRVAYEAAAFRPQSELKMACDLLDDALHRLYEEEAATAA